MKRWTTGVLVVGAVVALGAGAILLGGRSLSADEAQASAPSTATAAIERRTLKATTPVDGTLGYADSYAIANALATSGGADPASLAQAYANAQAQYDTAVAGLDALRHPKATDVANARAQLAQVAATLQAAQQAADGAEPKDIEQATAQLAAVQAQLTSAQRAAAGPTPAALAQAQAQLAQAQAQLISAQQAAAGPTAAQLAAAQAAVTQATEALTSDQAALAAAQAALAAAQAALAACTATPTPDPSASPAPTSAPCDQVALQLAVTQAQSRVTTDQAQLGSAQAALADLTSAGSQAQAQANVASAQAAVNSAQAALDDLTSAAGLAQAQSNLTSAQAAVTAAQAALDAVLRGNPAQAKAQLASARAQVTAARAALYALQHPTDAQIKAAKNGVSTARAQLVAAKAALGAPRGVLTQLAEVGSIVQPGQTLYTLDGTRAVVLLEGAVPAWRDLKPDVSDGPDIEELEVNLRDLGFGSESLTVDQHWDDQTTAAVKRWQQSLGLADTGVIPLGQVVFEPGPMRITANAATLGATIQAAAAVLEASSTEPVIRVALDPALQTEVKQGDPVTVILPDGSTTPGSVTDVGTVATTPAGDGGAAADSADPTIEVLVTLDDPSASGGLDQAPVSVNITTATAEDVLAVPVGALVQTLDGTYAVQVEEAGQLRYVPVELGLFAAGWVEISGSGLAEGQPVVVAQ